MGFAEKPETPARPGTFRRVVGQFHPYRRQISIVLVAIVFIAVLGLANPILLKLIIDDAWLHHDMGKLSLYVGLMITIPIITGLVGVLQTYFNNLIGQSVMRDLRNKLYQHLQAMSFQFFSDTKTGEIQSRLSNDVGGVQDVITNTASGTVSNFTTVLSTVVAMGIISWQLTILSLALMPVFLFMTYRIGRIRKETSKLTQETMARMTALMQESLSVSGVLLTKVFGRQEESLGKFRGENQMLADLELRQQMVGRWFFMMMSTFFSISPALVYWVAGWISFHGNGNNNSGFVTIGSIVAFTTLQSRLFFPIGQLLQVQVQFQGALALFDRIFEYLDLPIKIANKPGAVSLTPARTRGDLKFDGVSFRYTEDMEEPAVDGLSFEAQPGQLVALVGHSGAGKTTITYLAARLYDVNAGHVEIDDIDVRDMTLESLAAIIGMVTQETFLFHSSIRENLLFARPEATEKELANAARAANIYDKIRELPEGFDTIVGERGYRLSGGEKQRVAIARVVLKDPRILILDEATSALDTHSERLIQGALQPLMVGRTTLAIAHRLSTILRADQILMMERGRIVERGTHAELLVRGGAYSRLYHEQFADGRVEAQCEDGVIAAAS